MIYTNYNPSAYYLAHYGVLGMKWGVRKAENISNDAANVHRMMLNDINKKRYKRGEISKEEYKSGVRSRTEKFKMQKKKNRAFRKSQIASYKRDKEAFRNKYAKKRDIAEAAMVRAEKKVPNYRKIADAKDLTQDVTRALTLIGGIPIGVGGGLATYPYYAKQYNTGKQILEEIINNKNKS